MSIELQIQEQEIDHKIILRIKGRLDAASSPSLEKKVSHLIQEDQDFILLDLRNLDYLSSAGMRFLLSTTKQLKAKQGDLVLFGIKPEVMEIISMAGFEKILHICQDENQALHFS